MPTKACWRRLLGSGIRLRSTSSIHGVVRIPALTAFGRTSSTSKNAQDTESGAGQYSARACCFALPPPPMESFTPRPLIQAIVDVAGSLPGRIGEQVAGGVTVNQAL